MQETVREKRKMQKRYVHCATVYINEVYTHTHTSEDYIKNVLIVKIGGLGSGVKETYFFLAYFVLHYLFK